MCATTSLTSQATRQTSLRRRRQQCRGTSTYSPRSSFSPRTMAAPTCSRKPSNRLRDSLRLRMRRCENCPTKVTTSSRLRCACRPRNQSPSSVATSSCMPSTPSVSLGSCHSRQGTYAGFVGGEHPRVHRRAQERRGQEHAGPRCALSSHHTPDTRQEHACL